MSEPKQQDKPFQIDKIVVWEAFQRVKANKGAAGVDEQSIAEFEQIAIRIFTEFGTDCRRAVTFRRR